MDCPGCGLKDFAPAGIRATCPECGYGIMRGCEAIRCKRCDRPNRPSAYHCYDCGSQTEHGKRCRDYMKEILPGRFIAAYVTDDPHYYSCEWDYGFLHTIESYDSNYMRPTYLMMVSTG